MKIAFAVNLVHDPDFGQHRLGTSHEPIHLSTFLYPGTPLQPTAKVTSNTPNTSESFTVELWWIQGCCPVVSIESNVQLAVPGTSEISRADLQEVVDRALDILGRSSQSVFELFPEVPLVPSSILGPETGAPGSPVSWSRLFIESPALDIDPAAIRQIDPDLDPPTQILELAIETNITRLSHEFRQWSAGPINGEESEFSAWQAWGTALLHSIIHAHITLSTQKSAHQTDLGGITRSVQRLAILHREATTTIPVLQQSLAKQREGSLEEAREAANRERLLTEDRQRLLDAALADKEEQVHKLQDRFEKQKSYAYGAIGLVISVIALVPTIGALHPNSLETPYDGQVAWLAASLPLLVTFAVSLFVLIRSRSRLTTQLLRLTTEHHQEVSSVPRSTRQSPIPICGVYSPTHELGTAGRLHAMAHVMEDGTTVILKDSLAKAQTHVSVSLHTTTLRSQLISAGVLEHSEADGYLVFIQDHAFISLAAATRVIKAKALSRSEWRRISPSAVAQGTPDS
ncbi:hypothetical protein CQ018_08265 [Arthrobacter sp. MYb227]|uniref:DUF4357 domain-containing protein n=1 Tax=Arthrobacter sp. MYb227 TaxID=1848601 RepID=UPI000CFB9825|nr:hypothetical protein [Arthrobacter sp. MYb227]PQZ93648.1 hypothetical protein CQ018_08265 [Arthrobacter sp. MYb227]